MNPEHEIQVLQGLLTATRDSFNQRRSYQWKVNLAFWASIVAGAWALRNASLESVLVASLVLLLGGFVIVALFASWSYHLWRANAWDKTRALHYRNRLQALALYVDPFPESPAPPVGAHGTYRAWLGDWSQRHEFLITLILTVLAVAFLMMQWTRVV